MAAPLECRTVPQPRDGLQASFENLSKLQQQVMDSTFLDLTDKTHAIINITDCMLRVLYKLEKED
jgi:hypothetical protein